jgi:hypothetical protein
VDFDIIKIPKNYIGYNSWSDVPMDQIDFATEAITERIHFPTGIFNKRVTEDLINQEEQ